MPQLEQDQLNDNPDIDKSKNKNWHLKNIDAFRHSTDRLETFKHDAIHE